MKRKYLLTALLASFFIFVTFHGFDAHAAISGDEKCGKWDGTHIVNPCGINSLQVIFRGVMALIIGLGLPLLVVFVIFRFVRAWVALEQGNANAYKEAVQIAGQAILGFIVVTAVLGGVFLTILKYVGVKDSGDFNPLRLLQIISIVEVERAYAARVTSAQCNTVPEGTPCTTEVTRMGFVVKDAVGVDGFCARGGYGAGCIENPTQVIQTTICDGRDRMYCKTQANENGICFYNRCIKLQPEITPVTQTQTTSNSTDSANPTSSGYGLNDTKKDIGGLCYSDENCAANLKCSRSGGGTVDKGTCQTTAVYDASVKNATEINDARAQAGASAGNEKRLPNPLGFDDPYTFILSGVRLAIRFFFYPALIAIWTYCGFLYVAAQGAPEKLSKVHNLLIKAALTTFVVFATQGFLGALQGSVEKIVPGTTQTTQSTNQ